MPRRFTPAKARQNAAFLAALGRGDNARAAADALGVHRSTYLKRRARRPAFAQAWSEAVAVVGASAPHSAAASPWSSGPPGTPPPSPPASTPPSPRLS